MSFSDDLQSCMNPFPVPFLSSGDEALEFLHQIHQAWEAAGGEMDVAMEALIAAGAVVGLDEAAIGALAGATVATYLAALAGCAASAAGSYVWNLIASADSYVAPLLQDAAAQQGIPQEDPQNVEA